MSVNNLFSNIGEVGIIPQLVQNFNSLSMMPIITTSNVVFGLNAGDNITTGIDNVVIGDAAGHDLNTGNHNVIIGSSSALLGTTCSNNIILGNSTAPNLYSGINNVIIGGGSANALVNSDGSVVIGQNVNMATSIDAANTTNINNILRYDGAGTLTFGLTGESYNEVETINVATNTGTVQLYPGSIFPPSHFYLCGFNTDDSVTIAQGVTLAIPFVGDSANCHAIYATPDIFISAVGGDTNMFININTVGIYEITADITLTNTTANEAAFEAYFKVDEGYLVSPQVPSRGLFLATNGYFPPSTPQTASMQRYYLGPTPIDFAGSPTVTTANIRSILQVTIPMCAISLNIFNVSAETATDINLYKQLNNLKIVRIA